jgi:AcrR family transcriptional regulator
MSNDPRAPGGTSRRSRLPAAERRETIVRAAADVFAEAGYRAGKVSDIAARVGVTEPVIFQNFGSKAALFAAVVERAAAEARSSIDGFAAAFGSASLLLTHVLSGHSGEFRSGTDAGQDGHAHPATAFGVLFDDVAALTAEPDVAEPARAAIRAVAGHLTDVIERAQADGAIRSDADPMAAAWLILSVLSARKLRATAMPAHLESAVTALMLAVVAGEAGLREPGGKADNRR